MRRRLVSPLHRFAPKGRSRGPFSFGPPQSMLADVPSEIFATEALALRRAGFAVLPAHGKEPTRKGFSKWKHAPGPRAVAEWAEEDPTANIVYVPGLCRTERAGA